MHLDFGWLGISSSLYMLLSAVAFDFIYVASGWGVVKLVRFIWKRKWKYGIRKDRGELNG